MNHRNGTLRRAYNLEKEQKLFSFGRKPQAPHTGEETIQSNQEPPAVITRECSLSHAPPPSLVSPACLLNRNTMPVFESLSRTEIYDVMWRLKSKTSNTLGLIDLREATVPPETDDGIVNVLWFLSSWDRIPLRIR